MTDRTVAVRLRAEVGGYIAGIKQAAAVTKDLTKQTLDLAEKHKEAFRNAGIAAGAFGAAAGAAVGLAVKHFADFDQAMSGVRAATHASAADMAGLRDAALEAGARTVFSATEAADAIEQLAKAGVSTRDILGGGLNGALDLAAAGSLAVGDAAEIAATALTQFKLSGGAVPHVADLLAAGAGKAQGEVSDLAMALKQSGLVAAQMGLSVEETTGTLSAFAAAGLLGSDAGTSFRTMLLRLTNPAADAADTMKSLGINVYDAQGQFVGMQNLAGQLQTQMGKLAPSVRNTALATIFGSDAIRAANILYSDGARGIADWTNKVNDAGYAQETARIKLDNLKGDIEAFSGSLDTAFIKSGSAGNRLARDAVQSATAVVNAYNDLPPAAQSAATGLTAAAAVAGTAAGGFLLLAPRIQQTRVAMATLSAEMPRTTALMRGLGTASTIATVVAGAAIAIDALNTALTEAAPGIGALTDGLTDFIQHGALTGDAARILGDDFDNLALKIRTANKTKYISLADSMRFGTSGGSPIERDRRQLEALDQTLTNLQTSGHADAAAKIFREMADAAHSDGLSIEVLKKRFPQYTDAVAAATAETKLGANAQGDLASAAGGAATKLGEEKKSLSDLEKEIRTVTGLILGLRDSQRQYQQALDDAAAARKKNGRTLDIDTQKGRDNAAALDAIASSANDVLQAMIDSHQPYAKVSKTLAEQRTALEKAAVGFGVSKVNAKQYADSVLRIPKVAKTEVKAEAVAAKTALDEVQAKLDRLDGATVTSKVVIRQILTAPATAAKQDRLTHADGGWISGPGGPRDDMVPAWLSAGEYVVNARSAAQNAMLLEAINSGGRYADGGWVRGGSGGSSGGGLSEGTARELISAVKGARPINLEVTQAQASAAEIVDEAVFAARIGRL
jgi:TP901 family phage tail tape measure protein